MKKGKWFGLLMAVAVIALLMVQPADSKKKADPTVEQIRAVMTMINAELEAMGRHQIFWEGDGRRDAFP